MARLLQLLIITAFAIMVSAETDACSLKAKWDYAYKREDGTALPVSQMKYFELRCVGMNVKHSIIKFPRPGTKAYTATTSKAGRYSCVMFVHDLNGIKSKPSNTAQGDCK